MKHPLKHFLSRPVALLALAVAAIAPPVATGQEPQRYPQVYNSLASMAAQDVTHLLTTNCIVNIGLVANDGLEGPFYWNASSTTATNYDLIACNDTSTGRWVRVKSQQPLAAVTISTVASYVTDFSKARIYQLNLSTNLTLGVPTNAVNGQLLTWEFVQDATGNRTLTLATNYLFPTNFASITLVTNGGYRDIVQGVFHTNNNLIRITDWKGSYL